MERRLTKAEAAEWLKALRSGAYPQGQNSLVIEKELLHTFEE